MNHLARYVLLTFVGIFIALGITPPPVDADKNLSRPVFVAQEETFPAQPEFPVIDPVDEVFKDKPQPVIPPAPAAPAPLPTPPVVPVGPIDTYPSHLKDIPPRSILDKYYMYNRECVSYAAWKVEERTGYVIYGWGDAKMWPDAARKRGIAVDGNPVINSVAVSQQGQYGHVAIVTGVSSAGISVTEYNGGVIHGFSARTYVHGFFTEFIHL